MRILELNPDGTDILRLQGGLLTNRLAFVSKVPGVE